VKVRAAAWKLRSRARHHFLASYTHGGKRWDFGCENVYGQTEVSGATSMTRPVGSIRGGVGRPLSGVEVKVADDGELLVRSPSLVTRYVGDEDRTALAFNSGWFNTGDRARLCNDNEVVCCPRAHSGLGSGHRNPALAIERTFRSRRDRRIALFRGCFGYRDGEVGPTGKPRGWRIHQLRSQHVRRLAEESQHNRHIVECERPDPASAPVMLG
jgi:AMP-binding enzyme